jgi:hypothetical protein
MTAPLDLTDPIEVAAARRYVRALARWRCGGSKGRGKLDPVYVETTQGRDFRANWEHYSSCGDLLHCVAWDIGVRDEWVNRDDAATGRKWTFALPTNGGRDNISTLQGRKGHPGPAIVTPASYLPEPGDFGLCWHDDMSGVHVRIFGNTDAGVVETFDYGAGGMSKSEFPGAKCNHLRIKASGDGHLILETLPGVPYSSKRVQKIVPLPKLIEVVGDRRPSFDGGTIEEMERRVL